jgi:hypothetical protein
MGSTETHTITNHPGQHIRWYKTVISTVDPASDSTIIATIEPGTDATNKVLTKRLLMQNRQRNEHVTFAAPFMTYLEGEVNTSDQGHLVVAVKDQAGGDLNQLDMTTFYSRHGLPKIVDLTLEITASDETPSVTDTVTYMITLSRNGPRAERGGRGEIPGFDAAGIEVTAVIPTGTTFSSKIVPQGTYTEGTGLWEVGTMSFGDDDLVLHVDVTIDAGEEGNTISFPVSVTALRQTDPTPATATVDVVVNL